MANYIIIGGDGKQYGPITDVDLRKWFGEGRLNAQTMVKGESDAEFRPLSAFPEFADFFQTTAVPSAFATGISSRDEALRLVKGPAIALIITSSIDLLFGIFGLVGRQATMNMYSGMSQFNDPQMQQMLHLASGPIGILSSIFQLIITLVVLIAAIRMMLLKNYALAFAGAILALIPCMTPCCGLLTLPFGIWALVVLNKRDVKMSFN